MICNDVISRLDDLLEDRLAPDAKLRVETHLAECSSCRQRERQLRELLARAAALPRERQPRRDLWPGILEGLERGAAGGPVARPRFGQAPEPAPWRRWGLLAAAAMLLIAVSSGITAILLRPADRLPTSADPGMAATVAWEQFRSAESEYQRLSDELLTALESRREELSPDTVRVVEDNLALIDEAIREARAALETDPANAGLATKLTDIYRKRVSFLREMNRL